MIELRGHGSDLCAIELRGHGWCVAGCVRRIFRIYAGCVRRIFRIYSAWLPQFIQPVSLHELNHDASLRTRQCAHIRGQQRCGTSCQHVQIVVVGGGRRFTAFFNSLTGAVHDSRGAVQTRSPARRITGTEALANLKKQCIITISHAFRNPSYPPLSS